jgi:hypothetical protein
VLGNDLREPAGGAQRQQVVCTRHDDPAASRDAGCDLVRAVEPSLRLLSPT